MKGVRVKICGITNVDDALAAVEAGADALGFVFHPPSPRYLPPEAAAAIISRVPPFVQTVGVFVNEEASRIRKIAGDCGIDIVQLHGDETPEDCSSLGRRVIKAFRVKDDFSLDDIRRYRVNACLLDAWSPAAYGGTGETFNWEIARTAAGLSTVILAGGLTPGNVTEAVRQVAPYGVDVSGGVEKAPGIKDHAKIAEFIRRAKGLPETRRG